MRSVCTEELRRELQQRGSKGSVMVWGFAGTIIGIINAEKCHLICNSFISQHDNDPSDPLLILTPLQTLLVHLYIKAYYF